MDAALALPRTKSWLDGLARVSREPAVLGTLDEAVRRAEGNLSGAARLLGITRPQLQYRLKKKEGA